jgi:hypothetical protein
VAWFGYSWLAGALPPPTPHTPPPFPLRAPAEVSGWWGMVNIMEPGKPHRLDAKIPHWWSLWNVRSHEQSVPKFWAKTNLTGPLLPQQKETMKVPQNRRFCFDVYSSSPWAHLYRWKCQSIWAKSEVLIWRTCWEHIVNLGNILGTH